VKNIRFS